MVDKQKHGGQKALFSMIYNLYSSESDLCKTITRLIFATGPSPNQPEMHTVSQNDHEYRYW